MKICVSGYEGRIGQALIDLGCLPFDCDVTDYDAVERTMRQEKPDIIVHCASKSDVDWCEIPEHRNEVIKVNYTGTRNVVSSAHKHSCGVVYMSTDHIYSGRHGPYSEAYNFKARHPFSGYESPVNYYGLSKLTAEMIQDVYANMKIIRTSYNFTEERLQEVIEKKDYPTFLYRSFQYLPHLVENLRHYLDKFYEMPPVLNLAGSETISWYEFMCSWANICGSDGMIDNIHPRTKEIKGMAKRPHKAGLKIGLATRLGFKSYSYADGLMQMVAE